MSQARRPVEMLAGNQRYRLCQCLELNLLVEPRHRHYRSVNGRDNKTENQVVGTTRNRVFLQPCSSEKANSSSKEYELIDFSKIGTGSTVDTVLPPREIFNALPNKDAHKFQYPRDVQSQAAVFNPVVQMTAFKQPVYCAQFPAAFQD